MAPRVFCQKMNGKGENSALLFFQKTRIDECGTRDITSIESVRRVLFSRKVAEQYYMLSKAVRALTCQAPGNIFPPGFRKPIPRDDVRLQHSLIHQQGAWSQQAHRRYTPCSL